MSLFRRKSTVLPLMRQRANRRVVRSRADKPDRGIEIGHAPHLSKSPRKEHGIGIEQNRVMPAPYGLAKCPVCRPHEAFIHRVLENRTFQDSLEPPRLSRQRLSERPVLR